MPSPFRVLFVEGRPGDVALLTHELRRAGFDPSVGRAETEADFVAILTDTRASLTQQYVGLIGTEDVTISFTDDGIKAIARIAAQVNETVENIGARRLQTVMEKLLEEVSFDAEDRAGQTLTIDAAYVEGQLAGVAKNTDLSRYIL